MREGKLTVFTLGDGTSITTRSALEARWAIFFSELGLTWKYEPCRIDGYLPDFVVEGLGFVEIKPTLALLISESTKRIEKAARAYPTGKIYALCGQNVSFNTVALYQGKNIFAPTVPEMLGILCSITKTKSLADFSYHASISVERANRAKLDHFTTVGKVLDLEVIPASRKIVREASEKLKAEFNR